MRYGCCISYIFMSLIILPIITEVQKSYFSISNKKIEISFISISNISFCYSVQQDYCINKIVMKINSYEIQYSSATNSETFNVEVNGKTEITSSIDLQIKNSSHVTTFKHEYDFTVDSKEVTLNFTDGYHLLTMHLLVLCQPEYQGSKCNELKICSRLPPQLCKHNGSCYEENGLIKCRCRDGFKGDFCQELEKPCENNLCRWNAQCEEDNRVQLQYRCKCTDNYIGQFCEEIIDPCRKNLCSNNSTCLPDKNEILQYRCQCHACYFGNLCLKEIDNCSQKSKLNDDVLNATCIIVKNQTFCSCDDGCRKSNIRITATSTAKHPSFKWPLSESVSFSVLIIEAMVIVILVIVIIAVKVCCGRSNDKSVNENLMFARDSKYELEFGSGINRTPIKLPKIEDRRSMNFLYEGHDLQAFINSQPATDNFGKSTFGKV